MANVSKERIRSELAKKFKSNDECITVFGLKTKFGGGRSSGFALIYDSKDDKQKLDQKKFLLKVRALHFFLSLLTHTRFENHTQLDSKL